MRNGPTRRSPGPCVSSPRSPLAVRGGTLGATTGVYVAGPTGSETDVLKVTDSLGNTAQVAIAVGAGVSIAPANPSSPPRGSVALVASGGSNAGFAWSISSNKSGASVDGGGRYTAGATGNVTDTVDVVDSLGNTSSVDVSGGGGLSINPAAPSTPPRGTLAFAAGGGSGSGYTWSIEDNDSGGTIAAATGAYRAGPVGNVTDIVKLVDSLGNTLRVSVKVTEGVGISPAAATVAPLGTVPLGATGGSGSGFVWSFLANGSGGSISSVGVYQAGSTGGVTDTVRVTDSLGNSTVSDVTVTAAIAIGPTTTTAFPKGATTFTATGGTGSYTFTLQTNASGGNVSSTGGAYTAGPKGSVTDVVMVTDANGATATASVLVGPRVTIQPPSPTAPPLGPIGFAATGGSGSGFAWALATNASGGSIGAATGLYTAGATSFVTDVVRVTDSLGNTATVDVSVGASIAINPEAVTAPPRGTVYFAVIGGSGGYTWTLKAAPSGATIDAETGHYRAGPIANVTDIVAVTDGVGAIVTATVAVGPALTLTPPTASVVAGGKLSFAVAGGSGGGYAWAIPTNASGATIDATGVYAAGAKAGASDVVEVTDWLGNTASGQVSVTTAPPPPATTPSPSPSSPGTTTPASRESISGGCGCRTAVPRAAAARHVVLFVLAIAALVRRRRNRQPPAPPTRQG